MERLIIYLLTIPKQPWAHHTRYIHIIYLHTLTSSLMKESFLFLAEGFEEVEALTAVDILRRAGMPVKTVSITSCKQVVGAHGITVTADVLYDSVLFSDPSWLILPGGMPGATNLNDFAPLRGLLARQAGSEFGKIAAICASPAVVLGQQGLLKGEKATCYPGFEEMLEGAEYIDNPVVRSGRFVLGNGPANAMAWSLAIVEADQGKDKAEEVATGLLYYDGIASGTDNFFG